MTESSNRRRLEFLDGVRGLAAFYIVGVHLYSSYASSAVSPWLLNLMRSLRYGSFSVATFIVLSGYCLMLPVIRRPDHQLVGGVSGYLKRRARRILPPYYAALALVLLVYGIAALKRQQWLPPFSLADLCAHFALVHNVRPEWAFSFDYPMWSVATEWQIYFLFPAILLPVWRWKGNGAAVIVGILLGILPVMLTNAPLEQACPWYVGLFAMGMAAASAAVKVKYDPKAGRRAGWVAFALCLGVVLMLTDITSWPSAIRLRNVRWLDDLLIGAAAALLLYYLSLAAASGSKSFTLRALESRPVVRLGLFSYSLYLVHAPVLSLFRRLLRPLHLGPNLEITILALVGVPSALVASYLFHLAFERRFMSGSRRSAEGINSGSEQP